MKQVLKLAFLGNENKYSCRGGRILNFLQSLLIVFIGLYE